MKLALGLLVAALLPAASAQAQQLATAEAVEWAPVNSFNGEYRLSIPCSEEEIAAWRGKINPEMASSGAGCIRKDHTAIVLLFINTPPNFFEDLVSKSMGERVPPELLAGHRVLRTFAPSAKGDGEVSAQFVELDKSRILLVSFEAKPAGTAQSRDMAAKFLNSLELAPR